MRYAPKELVGNVQSVVGDVALVAVSGEFFGSLAAPLKARSPFANTCILGYIPDEDAYELGGYQVWAGFHSLVEQGVGEMIVEKAFYNASRVNRSPKVAILFGNYHFAMLMGATGGSGRE